jgi:predicted benzoate:H+ symporter BenE
MRIKSTGERAPNFCLSWCNCWRSIERSRRWRFGGRASAVLGPALMAGLVVGIIDYTPERVIAALALTIGGMVLMGSSRSSTEELERALKQAEAERMAAIDALELVQVSEKT